MMSVSARLVASALSVGALAGCMSSAAVDVPFDAKAAEYVLKPGTGRIEGEAFLRRDYGKLVTAAGEHVFLVPATDYTTERFTRMFDGDRRSYFGAAVADTPPDYYAYRRETKVDGRGKFIFDKLSPGRYIVATRVFWTEPSSYYTRGGAIYDIVEVRSDEITFAVVSGK